MHKSHQLFQPQLCLMLLSKPHLLTPHHPCCHQPGISYKRAEGKEILTLLLVPSTHCSTSAGNAGQQNPSTQDSFQASAGTHLSPQNSPHLPQQPPGTVANVEHMQDQHTTAPQIYPKVFLPYSFLPSKIRHQRNSLSVELVRAASLMNQPAQTAIEHQLLRL